jgi:hypothetical protein
MPLASATQNDVAGVDLASLPAHSQTTNSTDSVRGTSTDVSNLDVVGNAPGLDANSSIHTFVQTVTYGPKHVAAIGRYAMSAVSLIPGMLAQKSEKSSASLSTRVIGYNS